MGLTVNACTTDVPSENLVLNILFAFWNMPSFRLTTMNWLPLNLVLINRPIFCVWERSRAASTSSRIYIGAGLNWRRDMMSDNAMSERCPPESSVKLCFHTLPVAGVSLLCPRMNWIRGYKPSETLTSNPSLIVFPSGGSSLAKLPGSNSANICPKLRLTSVQVS